MTASDSTDVAHEIVDELVPAGFDWERYAVRYPRTSLAVAAAAGFWLGRRHGPVLISAVASFAAGHVTAAVDELVGDR